MEHLIIFAFLVLSILSISFSQLPMPTGLSVGEVAPDFTSDDSNGKKINWKQKLAKGTVILLFYRGEWCPYCNQQLKNLTDSLASITAKVAIIIAVTPEQKEQVAKTIEKTKTSFSIISDKNSKFMNAYKVGFTADSKTVELTKDTASISLKPMVAMAMSYRCPQFISSTKRAK